MIMKWESSDDNIERAGLVRQSQDISTGCKLEKI
jgi:hypothetical protein